MDQVWTSRAVNLEKIKSEPGIPEPVCCRKPLATSSTQTSLHNDRRSPRGALKGYEPKFTAGGYRKDDGAAASSDENDVSPS